MNASYHKNLAALGGFFTWLWEAKQELLLRDGLHRFHCRPDLHFAMGGGKIA
jgi:hypothetical protein